MTKEDMEAILERVRTWPVDRQEDAVAMLLAMEHADSEESDLTDEDLADLDEGLAEADRGEFVPDEEMKAFFAKYR